MKGGSKKILKAFSYPKVSANESSSSPGDQANASINSDNARSEALLNLTEGKVNNVNLNQLGGKIYRKRRLKKTKKRVRKQKGSGRTLNIPKELPSVSIPGPTYNGGLTIGEKCIGGHCSIPIDPLTSNYTNNNLKSANSPLKATYHYQGTDRLGNSQVQMPGVNKYTGTTINHGNFNILSTGGGRTLNIPKELPIGNIPNASYNSATSIGEPCSGNHCSIPVDSTTSNMISNNLKSANPPIKALNQYQGTNRLGNSNLSMPGVNKYTGTTLNHGPFNIITTGGGCSSCSSPYEAILSGGGYYAKIVNPVTGRKVSIFGKLGQKILGNYLNQL